MTWRCGRHGVIGDNGDVVLMVCVVVVIKQPLVGPNGHSQGQTTTAAAMVAVGEGGVGGKDGVWQCLATGDCQTFQLLLITILIIN